MFTLDEQKYPLLVEMSDYIQAVVLSKGDCLYVPSFYWLQYVSTKGDAIFINFQYETSNKLTQLLFDAIHELSKT